MKSMDFFGWQGAGGVNSGVLFTTSATVEQENGSHAIHLRNGIGLQANTPIVQQPGGKRRDSMSRYG